MENDFDYFDAVEREVLVEKLMKERKKKAIYNVLSPPSSTRECLVQQDHKCAANHDQGRGRKQSRDGVA